MISDECVYWLMALVVAVAVVGSILWFIVQTILLCKGQRPRLIARWRNLKEIMQLFREQENPTHRRWSTLTMHLFLGCLCVAVVCFVVLFVLFFIFL